METELRYNSDNYDLAAFMSRVSIAAWNRYGYTTEGFLKHGIIETTIPWTSVSKEFRHYCLTHFKGIYKIEKPFREQVVHCEIAIDREEIFIAWW